MSNLLSGGAFSVAISSQKGEVVKTTTTLSLGACPAAQDLSVLLATMFERHTRIGRMILEQYRNNYGPVLFDVVIPTDSKLRESPVFGRPITQYADGARGAREYCALERELMACQKVMT